MVLVGSLKPGIPNVPFESVIEMEGNRGKEGLIAQKKPFPLFFLCLRNLYLVVFSVFASSVIKRPASVINASP